MSIGAAVGTLCAEFTVCAYQTYKVRNELDIQVYLKQSVPLIIISLVMYFIVMFVPLIKSMFITLILKILIGILLFVLLVYLFYKDMLFDKK